MTEDIYTNGSAPLGSPAHVNGREMRKIRYIQFEKVTEEPMVSQGKRECLYPCGAECQGCSFLAPLHLVKQALLGERAG